MRKVALERFNLSLGGGLGPLMGKVFRIGHLGDLNEPMLLGCLATTELAMKTAGVPFDAGRRRRGDRVAGQLTRYHSIRSSAIAITWAVAAG